MQSCEGWQISNCICMKRYMCRRHSRFDAYLSILFPYPTLMRLCAWRNYRKRAAASRRCRQVPSKMRLLLLMFVHTRSSSRISLDVKRVTNIKPNTKEFRARGKRKSKILLTIYLTHYRETAHILAHDLSHYFQKYKMAAFSLSHRSFCTTHFFLVRSPIGSCLLRSVAWALGVLNACTHSKHNTLFWLNLIKYFLTDNYHPNIFHHWNYGSTTIHTSERRWRWKIRVWTSTGDTCRWIRRSNSTYYESTKC